MATVTVTAAVAVTNDNVVAGRRRLYLVIVHHE